MRHVTLSGVLPVHPALVHFTIAFRSWVNLNKRHESPTESGSLRRLGDRRPVTGQPDQGHREALLNAMRNVSVGAYGHVNLYGDFGFFAERMDDSIGLWSDERRFREMDRPGLVGRGRTDTRGAPDFHSY